MPASPEQLERRIAMTRSELANTLAELEDRTNPVAIVRRNRRKLVVAGGVAAAFVVIAVVAAIARRT